MAASPFLVKGVCSPLSGLAADVLRKSTVSTKNVRRVFYAAGTKKKTDLQVYIFYTSKLAKGFFVDLSVVIVNDFRCNDWTNSTRFNFKIWKLMSPIFVVDIVIIGLAPRTRKMKRTLYPNWPLGRDRPLSSCWFHSTGSYSIFLYKKKNEKTCSGCFSQHRVTNPFFSEWKNGDQRFGGFFSNICYSLKMTGNRIHPRIGQ